MYGHGCWRALRGPVARKADGRRRAPLCIAFAFGFGLATAGPATAEQLDACALVTMSGSTASTPETGRVSQVTGANAVLFEDGREIRLSGISTPHRFQLPASRAAEADAVRRAEGDIAAGYPDPPPAASFDSASDPIALARSRLSAWLIGEQVRIYPISASPDRYGRIRARVVRASDGLWIEAELVSEGLARVEPQRDDFGCARHLEAIEEIARASEVGLWALPEFAVLQADDLTRDRFIGHYVLIEGKVASLGRSGTRRYLNFGRNFSRDLAVLLIDKGAPGGHSKTLPASRFREEGFEAPDVAGKRLRVRGILTRGGGGLILPGVPEELEWLPPGP